MPDNDKDKHEKEYAILLALFDEVLKSIRNNDGQWESLEDLIAERADIGIRHAFEGFGISYDDAIELLRNADNLTDEQRAKRDILVAAVDNIVDFSTAEEYHMIDELPELELEEGEDEEDIDPELLEEVMSVFSKYNHTYAWTENLDIEYAMAVAAYLVTISSHTILTYMTMGDERVRPWHLQYEGYSAPKSQFPAWLIPPIEHGCRCFLVEDSQTVMSQIKNEVVQVPEIPAWFNKTFKESVALGGRIFSDEHPYFQINDRHFPMLNHIAYEIKKKYLANA